MSVAVEEEIIDSPEPEVEVPGIDTDVEAPEPKVYGVPYVIVAYYSTAEPNLFPMMKLNPAIDAARAIIKDGMYHCVRVVNNYDRTKYAEFNRYNHEIAGADYFDKEDA